MPLRDHSGPSRLWVCILVLLNTIAFLLNSSTWQYVLGHRPILGLTLRHGKSVSHVFSDGAAPAPLVGPGVKSGRCLKFIHIPKAGGTTVEHVGFQYAKSHPDANTSWGAYDTQKRCSTRCSKHHIPPAEDKCIASFYRDSPCDVFCVVRHPLERLISEWKYQAAIGFVKNWTCSTRAYATWVVSQMKRVERRPSHADCHLLPQVRFVFADTNLTDQVCTRILRTEALTQEFNSLMLEYGFRDMKMKGRAYVGRPCDLQLPWEVHRRVVEYYKDDFRVFGYSSDWSERQVEEDAEDDSGWWI